jgi:hypothetical protein
MSEYTKLIEFIESPQTSVNERERCISELNLQGVGDSKIQELAYDYWQRYFAQNMDEILSKKYVLISHLLPDELLNQCFTDVFEEYKNKKKEMGIDDIRKFWAP